MGLLDWWRHPDQDDMNDVERAIAHNEARGDPVPLEWYELASRGGSFDDDEESPNWWDK